MRSLKSIGIAITIIFALLLTACQSPEKSDLTQKSAHFPAQTDIQKEDYQDIEGEKIAPKEKVPQKEQKTNEPTKEETKPKEAPLSEKEKSLSPENTRGQDKQSTAETLKEDMTCSLSVRCDSVLKNPDKLKEEKKSLIPQNGIIFENKSAVFFEGESVFNVLLRELKKNKIHLEFENTPQFNSVYIEGIGNLYEFDCGERSGWIYKVNGEVLNVGCSRYKLKSGDKVEFLYSCDLGNDI